MPHGLLCNHAFATGAFARPCVARPPRPSPAAMPPADGDTAEANAPSEAEAVPSACTDAMPHERTANGEHGADDKSPEASPKKNKRNGRKRYAKLGGDEQTTIALEVAVEPSTPRLFLCGLTPRIVIVMLLYSIAASSMLIVNKLLMQRAHMPSTRDCLATVKQDVQASARPSDQFD